ncbi:MAG: cyclic peptide export ABC transporter [Flavobacteriaceae bacterium]
MLKKIIELTQVSRAKIFSGAILSIMSGLSGFFFITLVNNMIRELIDDKPLENSYLTYFVGILIAFFLSKRILAGMIIKLSQELHWNIRKNIVKDILKAPQHMVKKKRDEIYSSLTSDVSSIVNGSLMLIELVSSIILIIACFIYMFILSWQLSLISILVISMGSILYLARIKTSDRFLNNSRSLEQEFMLNFNSIINGIKEIMVNPVIGRKISNKISIVVDKAKDNDIKGYTGYLNTEITGRILFYLLIMFILYFSNSLLDQSISVSISFVFVILYLLGPVAMVTALVPVINKTVISLNRLMSLKQELEDNVKKDPIEEEKEPIKDFNTIEFNNYSFSYGENLFSVGPYNLKINKGDIIFLFGGNGSGKTTWLNTMLNVYRPNSGEILIDGEHLDFDSISSYKQMFSPVFSDFFLFSEFYGIDKLDPKEVEEYMELFELSDKVSVDIENKKFSTTDLSTGQRKRLALINSILEKKPLLVLDEWAADQDPIFRQKFYREIIPYLSEKGFTLILITHDDKYYGEAKRLLKMEYGAVSEITNNNLTTDS